MNRLLLTLLGAYGYRLSRDASRTIARIGEEARSGDSAAREHFTQTRYARVLGPKNSDLGMLFYGALCAAAATGQLRESFIHRVMFGASCASLGMSLYLLWALAFRLRVWCPICMKGHLLNAITFLILHRMR